MKYSITIKKRALKALEKINEPYYTSIYSLVGNPRPNGYKKLKGQDGYRIQVGDYRIIYDIFDKALVIDVIDLGHRKEIYG
jgi:mRNA interferase RelE/StbE